MKFFNSENADVPGAGLRSSSRCALHPAKIEFQSSVLLPGPKLREVGWRLAADLLAISRTNVPQPELVLEAPLLARYHQRRSEQESPDSPPPTPTTLPGVGTQI